MTNPSIPEPERRDARRPPGHQHKEKKQVVAGFIIFRNTPEGPKFLLLYRRGSYWNFPKGHFHTGENAMATALRETEEETGIKPADLRVIPGFKTYVNFHFFVENRKISDTLILYLAETREAQVRIEPREHSGYAWFFYADAVKILGKYAGTKRALKSAWDFLRQKSGGDRPPHPARRGHDVRRSGPSRRPSPGGPGGRVDRPHLGHRRHGHPVPPRGA